MVQFDNRSWQAKIKVVYYGPALGGKTTCLQAIHRTVDPKRRTKLYSLNTASDRTLFFDLLGLDLGRIRGYRLLMQVFTVPGQVQYIATRKAVLQGADGVVFVADSHPGRRQANIESLKDLTVNLMASGLDPKTIPLILHYNKRDLPDAVDPAVLGAELNPTGLPAVPSVAVTGEGVLEAFAAIAEKTLASVADRVGIGGNKRAVGRLQEQVRKALQPYLSDEPLPIEDVEITLTAQSAPPEEALAPELLAEEAVRANLAMADLNVGMDVLKRDLEAQGRKIEDLRVFGDTLRGLADGPAILRETLNTGVRTLEVSAGALSLVTEAGEYWDSVVNGIKADPFASVVMAEGRTFLAAALEKATPILIDGNTTDAEREPFLKATQEAGYSAALVIPMEVRGIGIGLLSFFFDRDRAGPNPFDLDLAATLAGIGAVAYLGVKSGPWASPPEGGSIVLPESEEKETRVVGVADVVKAAVGPLRKSAVERKVELSVVVPQGVASIEGDKEALAAALREIIENAIRFNHAAGQVRVDAALGGTEEAPVVTFRIVDSGVGISERDLPEVFDAAPTAGSGRAGGGPDKEGPTGLSFAKKVIEDHGGMISIRSWLARGTEVNVVLPRAVRFEPR